MLHQRKKWRPYLLSVAVFVVAVVLLTQILPNTAAEVTKAAKPAATSVVLASSTLPLRVSGLVKAADAAVVSAKTAGVIDSLLVTEGTAVQSGTLLFTQATPVADAQRVLREAEISLTSAEQGAAVATALSGVKKAAVNAYSAEEIALLTELSTDNRVAEATAGLLATEKASVTVLLDVLQFVEANRSLFDAASLASHEAIVAELYGSVPKQFQSGVANAANSEAELLPVLEALATAEVVSVVDVQNVGALIDAELQSLLVVYAGGEREVLDKQVTTPSGTIYTQYFARRESLHDAQENLISARATLQSAIDAAHSALMSSGTNVAVSTIDEQFARTQAQFSAAIEAAAGTVARAAVGVVAAEQSLGQVRAPFAGVVTKRFKEIGEYAAPGEPVLKVVGVGGKEVAVTVPAVLAQSVTTGLPFTVAGETVGVVDRFSPFSEGGAVTVVIALNAGSDLIVDTSVVGTIALTTTDQLFAVPRAYVQFASSGAFIRTNKDETRYTATVVYDAGELLFISTDAPTGEPLQAAYSIALP